MAGSVYTYVGNTSPQSGDAALETSQGWVPLGQSGLFLASEAASAQQDGAILTAGPSVSPASQLTAPSVAAGAAGNPNGSYRYAVTFVTAAGETTPVRVVNPITLTNVQGSLTALPVGTATSGVTARKIYRTAAGGAAGTEKLVGTVSDNITTTFTDNVADGSLGANVPTVDTSAVAVSLTNFEFTQAAPGTTLGQEGL